MYGLFNLPFLYLLLANWNPSWQLLDLAVVIISDIIINLCPDYWGDEIRKVFSKIFNFKTVYFVLLSCRFRCDIPIFLGQFLRFRSQSSCKLKYAVLLRWYFSFLIIFGFSFDVYVAVNKFMGQSIRLSRLSTL